MFKFSDVLVSSYQTGGSEGAVFRHRLGLVQLRQDRDGVQAAEARRIDWRRAITSSTT